MNEERWRSFSAFVARLLGKPTFDREEREPRLRVAAELAESLAGVASGDVSEADLAETLSGSGYWTNDLTAGRHRRWFGDWLRSGDEGLRTALASFADGGRDELERFDAFAGAYGRAVEAGRIEADAITATAIGSLLNFAVEPETLPLVLERPLRTLEAILGAETVAGGTPSERYRGHLAFARAVERDLRAAGVPVRDMLDIQGPMLLAARKPGFWAETGDTAADAGRTRPPDVYLSVCAIYRDEAPYIREWIEFHRVVGVERFFLYDNLSKDDHLSVLAPYVESGIVRLHDWPMEGRAQVPAYEHCVREHGAESRWIAFIDLDEFLFSPTGRPLPEILAEYERWPAVGVNWAVFGPSGHERKPPGLVIENYDRRVANTTIKSIADPAHVGARQGPSCLPL